MVRFKKRSFVIEVETDSRPELDWEKIQEALIDVLQAVESDAIATNDFYWLLHLLKSMNPDIEDLKKRR